MPIISLILSLFSGDRKGTAIRIGAAIVIVIALMFIFQCNLINVGSNFRQASQEVTKAKQVSVDTVTESINSKIKAESDSVEVKTKDESMEQLQKELEGEFKPEK